MRAQESPLKQHSPRRNLCTDKQRLPAPRETRERSPVSPSCLNRHSRPRSLPLKFVPGRPIDLGTSKDACVTVCDPPNESRCASQPRADDSSPEGWPRSYSTRSRQVNNRPWMSRPCCLRSVCVSRFPKVTWDGMWNLFRMSKSEPVKTDVKDGGGRAPTRQLGYWGSLQGPLT